MELRFDDDILHPRNKITLSFKGKNPYLPCQIIVDLARDILKISAKDVFIKDLRWDATSDPRSFYGVWYFRHEEDRWTDTMLKVTMQGEQSATDKTGWIKIDLEGKVSTKFEYSNFLQKALWFLFNRSFYYRQRRAYLEQGKEFIYKLREEILSALNIPVRGWEEYV